MDFRAGTADTFRAERDRVAAFAARCAGWLAFVVGIVVVSHNPALVEGVCELAAHMAGPDVSIVTALGGGLRARCDELRPAIELVRDLRRRAERTRG